MSDDIIVREAKVRVYCLREGNRREEDVFVKYVVQEDESRLYTDCNGCEQADGSEACQKCVTAVPYNLTYNQDQNLRKPFFPSLK